MQAGVLQALPQVDLETAEDLQRCQQSCDDAVEEAQTRTTCSEGSEHALSQRLSLPSSSGRDDSINSQEPEPSSSSDAAGEAFWALYNADEDALLRQRQTSGSHASSSRNVESTVDDSLYNSTAEGERQSRRAERGRARDSGPSEAALLGEGAAAETSTGHREPVRSGVVPVSVQPSGEDSYQELQLFASVAVSGQEAAAVDTAVGPALVSSRPKKATSRVNQQGGAETEWTGWDEGVAGSSGGAPEDSMSRVARRAAEMRQRQEAGAPERSSGGMQARAPSQARQRKVWTRCSTFALVPSDEAAMCAISDAAGNMCASATLLACMRLLLPRCDYKCIDRKDGDAVDMIGAAVV